MWFYNRRISKKLDSPAMEATAADSLSDCVATTAVLAATLIGQFTGLKIDGWCGVLVAAFIFWSGIGAARYPGPSAGHGRLRRIQSPASAGW